ncbi:hypothetical protein G7M36_25190 [Escherichia coli]|nr:hypothetical protein [Escherichia coli]
MPAFEWVHVQLHQQKGMISLSPPTICNSAEFSLTLERCDEDLRERLQSSSFSDMLSGFKDKVTSSLNSAASSVKGLF